MEARPSDLSTTLGAGPHELPELAGAPEVTGYRIVGRLGSGGMGAVYEAEEQHPRRSVALKVVHGGEAVDEHRLRLFEREIRTLARLHHPGIATLYSAGHTAAGQHYFAMELVRGETLGAHVARLAPSLRERLRLFGGICEAVSYAHQRGVIHRDLKPTNILIDSEGQPRVLDFGLAKITDADLQSVATEAGRIQGTLQYMSPEQARGNPDEIDTRSDVYALGVVLYELLTDTVPYDVRAVTWVQALRMICEQAPRRPSRTHPRLRGDLEVIALKALEKEPDQRYPSVAALADDVRRYLHDQPITARPQSAAYQIRKLVKRHQAPVAFASLALLLVVGFGLAMSVLYARAERHLARALLAEEKARQEASAATRVADFLTGLFQVADPGEARGNSITAREILDRGARQVSEGLRAEPIVQASLMQTMGRVYQNLGLYEPARRLLEDSLARRQERLGADHVLVAEALIRLAELDYYRGEFAQGVPRVERALAIQERELGPDDLAVAQSLYILGSLHNRTGAYGKAEPALRRCLAIREKVRGPDHPDVAEILNELGSLFQDLDRAQEAETAYRRALAIRERALGSDHPEVATSLNNLASVLARSRPAESSELYRRTIALRERIQGPDHPDLAIAIYNLGVNEQQQAHLEEAAAAYQRALAILEGALGPDHPHTAHCLNTMGTLETLRGRHRQAEALLQRSLAVRQQSLGADSPLVADSLADLGRLRIAQKRPAEALPLLARARAIQEKALGPGHSSVAATLDDEAAALRLLGRGPEALERGERARSIRAAR